MHKIIRILVYAYDHKEALERGRMLLERLCDCQKPYDYYTIFGSEEDDGSWVSGTGRFGPQPQAILATSTEGKKIIEQSMQYTLENIQDAWKKVKLAMFKGNPEDFFEHELQPHRIDNADEDDIEWYKDIDMPRHYFNHLGYAYAGNCWVYGNDGEGVLSRRHLNNILNKWNRVTNEYDDMNIYIISADVHY